MVAMTVTAFSGAMPIRDLRLLPAETPVEAVNVRTDGGSLKPINGPSLIKNLLSTTRSVYKLPYADVGGAPLDPSVLVGAKWLEFDDINTDVLRTPNVNDSFKRYYWCSPSEGFKYATQADLLSGGPSTGIGVGIEAPQTQMVILPAGGVSTAPTVTRAYYQTFVSIYGEEGQPGPITEAVGKVDDLWAITSIDQPVNGPGTTEIDRIRIYRTVTSASGVSQYYRVTTFPIGVTVFDDDLTDAVVSANQISESLLWAPPPDGLQGIVAMPNGIFVGWADNTLYFSENNRPHAWPAEYALAVQFPIVGLGVFGTTCVVCTTGNPASVTGIKSSVMALTQGKVSMPCTSRRGIVSTLEGVYYPSNDGLVLVTAGGTGNITQQIISRDQWIRDYKPTELKALHSRGVYTALRETDAFMIPTGVQPATQLGVVDADPFVDPKNFGIDDWSGSGWLIDDGKLYEWEPAVGDSLLQRWRSKEFNLPKKGNLGVAQLFFDYNSPPGNEDVRLRVWADRRLVFDQPIAESEREVRLPSGFKAHIWQFEVESKVRVHNINLASSSKELRDV